MKNNRLSAREFTERLVLALLFTAIGSLIMIVFSPMRPLLDKGAPERVADYLGRIGLIAILLAATLLVRKSKRLEKHGQVLLGLLIMAIAVSMDRIFGIYLIVYLKIGDAALPVGLS